MGIFDRPEITRQGTCILSFCEDNKTNILLVFDYESYVLYVPDNYIFDLQKIHLDFFKWLEDQKENIVDAGGRMALSYGPRDFLRYINNVLLWDSKEVAVWDSLKGL